MTRKNLETAACCLYENPALRLVTGEAIRPGGLALTRQALELFPLPGGALVLDIGCGNGATLRYLQDHLACLAVGVDLSSLLLQEGRQKVPLLCAAQARGTCLPFAGNLFNAVLAECSLSLIPDLSQGLREARRILRTGGYFFITDLYLRKPSIELEKMGVLCCLKGAKTATQLLDAFSGAGFSLCFWKDCSEHLRSLTAQLVFNYGSMQSFWQESLPGLPAPDAFDLQLAISNARPGYFMCVLQKD